MQHRTAATVLVAAALAAGRAPAQQVADSSFNPPVPRPAYDRGAGPVVAIDEGHHNFHTAGGRYLPFAELLRRDGYVVRSHAGALTDSSLASIAVLVIANPLHPGNLGNWTLPTPSAFAPGEIEALRAWVERGGSLLLVADHMPFAGAAADLAAAFGVGYLNGFVRDSTREEPMPFTRADGSLADHPVTRGRDAREQVTSVRTFTGSAFRAAAATPLLVLGPAAFSLQPTTAWRFDSTTAREDVAGWYQGAVMRVGRGRLAAFGEAAMFSAQLGGAQRSPMGMNSPLASQNPQFLLNLLHWLSGLLD